LGEPVHGERDSVFGLSLHVLPPVQHPGGSVWCHCQLATAVLLPWPAYVRDRPAGDGHTAWRAGHSGHPWGRGEILPRCVEMTAMATSRRPPQKTPRPRR
jgi:hypothetical protein